MYPCFFRPRLATKRQRRARTCTKKRARSRVARALKFFGRHSLVLTDLRQKEACNQGKEVLKQFSRSRASPSPHRCSPSFVALRLLLFLGCNKIFYQKQNGITAPNMEDHQEVDHQ